MRAPKIVQICDGCHAKRKSRYRVLVDRYLCEPCYRKPAVSAPLAVVASQRAMTVEATPEPDAEFDLRHLQR